LSRRHAVQRALGEEGCRTGLGAIVTECEPTLQARQDTVERLTRQLEREGEDVEFVSPYDDVRVIAGQGTAALELMEQTKKLTGRGLDVLIVPVGGGGLLSGCSVAAKGVEKDVWVVGAEPKGADDAFRSFYAKQFFPSVAPITIADGLLTSLGTHTFPLILEHVDAIHTVTEEQILRATKLVYERMKIVIEPSAAVSLAVALYSPEFVEATERLFAEKQQPLNVGVVFSGGNVDLSKLVDAWKGLD